MRTTTLALLSLCSFGFAQEAFVPVDFRVPTLYQTSTFQLVPLGPKVVKQDYDAYMSSIEHLQKTFGGGKWPHAGLTMTDAMKDMENEETRFKSRRSFAYAVLTPDGSKELGSVYVRPSRKQGYDAQVTMWVTKEQFDRGFEEELFKAVKAWIGKDWPFQKVGYPKREPSEAEWNALPNKPAPPKQ
jgi:hypothetical protein